VKFIFSQEETEVTEKFSPQFPPLPPGIAGTAAALVFNPSVSIREIRG
jgi:hypothetical protein